MDLAQSLVAAEHLIRHPQPGQLIPDQEGQSEGEGMLIASLPTRKRPRRSTLYRQVSIKRLDLLCEVKDIPDPPALSYKDRIEDLIEDWLFGSDLKCNGINVPLIYWRALYKPFRPNVWAKIKGEWGEWRVSNVPF
jgi:hypothetical protein